MTLNGILFLLVTRTLPHWTVGFWKAQVGKWLDDADQSAISLPVLYNLSEVLIDYPTPTPQEFIHSPQMIHKESEDGSQSACHAGSRGALQDIFLFKKCSVNFLLPITWKISMIFPPKSSSHDLKLFPCAIAFMCYNIHMLLKLNQMVAVLSCWAGVAESINHRKPHNHPTKRGGSPLFLTFAPPEFDYFTKFFKALACVRKHCFKYQLALVSESLWEKADGKMPLKWICFLMLDTWCRAVPCQGKLESAAPWSPSSSCSEILILHAGKKTTTAAWGAVGTLLLSFTTNAPSYSATQQKESRSNSYSII